MLHLLLWPLKLLWSIIMLPVNIVLGLFHLAVGTLAFVFHIGIWIACVALAVTIGQSKGLNPILCLVLGMLGPIGLLIVIGLALLRPSRVSY